MNPKRTRYIHVPPSERVAATPDNSPPTLPIVDPTPMDAGKATKLEQISTSLYDLYAIKSKIGDGGMGIVYLAVDKRLERFVAIKRLNQESQKNPSLRQRFLQEARAVATLNHIYIIHIYALGEDDEGPYIVMEYVEGPAISTSSRELQSQDALNLPGSPLSMEQLVSEEGQYTVNEAIELIVKVGKAIAYAHANGVIHRDLKPSNVLIDSTGEPKIIDFGLARLAADDQSKLTGPGEKLLSLGYGAPEQENDASMADHRADIYGLGALLYFAITGKNPRYFREQDIPLSLREVLSKALATDREQRWDSATEFLKALQSILSRTRVEQPTTKTTWRCKWCDTVNPLTIRFCSECGWDGSESCPECGAERFVGVQFCGSCGADSRIYESIITLAHRMQAALAATEFERVISLASRAQGFEPAGPSGRNLLATVQQLTDEANASIQRRDQLKSLIPMELRAENYERAELFIKEYRKLAGNQQIYSEEISEIPALLVKRDLKHARRACSDGEWQYALQLCDDLLKKVAPDNPDCLAMRRMVLRRRAFKRAATTTLAIAAVFLAYLALLPTIARSAAPPLPRVWQVVFRPAAHLYQAPVSKKILTPLLRICGYSTLTPYFQTQESPLLAASDDPLEMQPLAKTYASQLSEFDFEHKTYQKSWPRQYLQELDTLMERRRNAGDYESWRDINDERLQFARYRQISAVVKNEFNGLSALKNKYQSQADAARFEYARRVVNATKKYLNELSNLQSAYTKDGKMEAATSVNNEMRRVRAAAVYAEAEAVVAEQSYSPDSKKTVSLPAEQRIAELRPLRQSYEEQLAAIESEFSLRMEKWPDTYQQALAELMNRYQTAGDFSGWDAVRDEMDRFEIEHQLLAPQMQGVPQLLVEAQQKQWLYLQKLRRKRAQDIVELASTHLEKLEEFQSKYTKAGEMEIAGAINTEIRRLGNSPEIAVAREILAQQVYTEPLGFDEDSMTAETTDNL